MKKEINTCRWITLSPFFSEWLVDVYHNLGIYACQLNGKVLTVCSESDRKIAWKLFLEEVRNKRLLAKLFKPKHFLHLLGKVWEITSHDCPLCGDSIYCAMATKIGKVEILCANADCHGRAIGRSIEDAIEVLRLIKEDKEITQLNLAYDREFPHGDTVDHYER
jgi:hypothetical protein